MQAGGSYGMVSKNSNISAGAEHMETVEPVRRSVRTDGAQTTTTTNKTKYLRKKTGIVEWNFEKIIDGTIMRAECG